MHFLHKIRTHFWLQTQLGSYSKILKDIQKVLVASLLLWLFPIHSQLNWGASIMTMLLKCKWVSSDSIWSHFVMFSAKNYCYLQTAPMAWWGIAICFFMGKVMLRKILLAPQHILSYNIIGVFLIGWPFLFTGLWHACSTLESIIGKFCPEITSLSPQACSTLWERVGPEGRLLLLACCVQKAWGLWADQPIKGGFSEALWFYRLWIFSAPQSCRSSEDFNSLMSSVERVCP